MKSWQLFGHGRGIADDDGHRVAAIERFANNTLANISGAAVNHNPERIGGMHGPDPDRNETEAQNERKPAPSSAKG
jgi:hypothetical protein